MFMEQNLMLSNSFSYIDTGIWQPSLGEAKEELRTDHELAGLTFGASYSSPSE
jgi:hypothetical protein